MVGQWNYVAGGGFGSLHFDLLGIGRDVGVAEENFEEGIVLLATEDWVDLFLCEQEEKDSSMDFGVPVAGDHFRDTLASEVEGLSLEHVEDEVEGEKAERQVAASPLFFLLLLLVMESEPRFP